MGAATTDLEPAGRDFAAAPLPDFERVRPAEVPPAFLRDFVDLTLLGGRCAAGRLARPLAGRALRLPRDFVPGLLLLAFISVRAAAAERIHAAEHGPESRSRNARFCRGARPRLRRATLPGSGLAGSLLCSR